MHNNYMNSNGNDENNFISYKNDINNLNNDINMTRTMYFINNNKPQNQDNNNFNNSNNNNFKNANNNNFNNTNNNNFNNTNNNNFNTSYNPININLSFNLYQSNNNIQDNSITIYFLLKNANKNIFIDVNKNDKFSNVITELEEKYNWLQNSKSKKFYLNDIEITNFDLAVNNLGIENNTTISIEI